MRLLAAAAMLVTTFAMTSNADAASSGWAYKEEKDKMTDATSKYALVESEERAAIGIEPAAALVIGQEAKKPVDVYFIINTGMSNVYCMDHCSNAECSCTLSIRSDGGPIEHVKFRFTPTLGNTKQYLTFSSPPAILSKLRTAKKLVLEYKTVRVGSISTFQAEFNVAGLKWP